MRAIVFSCFVLAGIGQSTAAAAGTGGYNLGWDECGLAGAANKDFACNTNVGSRDIVVSFVLPNTVSRFAGTTVILQADALSSAQIPDWWAFASCRAGALTATGNVTALSGCVDPYAGHFVDSAVGVTEMHPQPNGVRFGVSTALSFDHEESLAAGIEYYAVRFTINNVATMGSGSCAGCSASVSITATSLRISQRTKVPITLTNPHTQGTITWQGGVVPVRNRTWGQIKGMYR